MRLSSHISSLVTTVTAEVGEHGDFNNAKGWSYALELLERYVSDTASMNTDNGMCRRLQPINDELGKLRAHGYLLQLLQRDKDAATLGDMFKQVHGIIELLFTIYTLR